MVNRVDPRKPGRRSGREGQRSAIGSTALVPSRYTSQTATLKLMPRLGWVVRRILTAAELVAGVSQPSCSGPDS